MEIYSPWNWYIDTYNNMDKSQNAYTDWKKFVKKCM